MRGFTRFNAALLASTLLLTGICATANAQIVNTSNTFVVAQVSAAAKNLANERQRLLQVYNTKGTNALVAELKKKSTMNSVNIERKRLLDLYTQKGRAALVADLRGPVAAKKPVVKPRPSATATPVPTPVETPYVAPTPEPTPYVEPTPFVAPSPRPTPIPMVTSAPHAYETPAVVVVAPSTEPMFSVKAGYWAANNELAKNFLDNNTGMITGNLELMPMGPNQAIGLSIADMTYPRNLSSNFWDAYFRFAGIKLGYRNEELLRHNIFFTPTVNKEDIRSESLFAGLLFGIPMSDMFSLDFDLNGGSTIRNVPVGASERVFTDFGVMLTSHAPGDWMNLNLGYRSYVFGTMTDLTNVYTMKGARSPFFGSYQGPIAGVGLRF